MNAYNKFYNILEPVVFSRSCVKPLNIVTIFEKNINNML